jgi:hypothetical protein
MPIAQRPVNCSKFLGTGPPEQGRAVFDEADRPRGALRTGDNGSPQRREKHNRLTLYALAYFGKVLTKFCESLPKRQRPKASSLRNLML